MPNTEGLLSLQLIRDGGVRGLAAVFKACTFALTTHSTWWVFQNLQNLETDTCFQTPHWQELKLFVLLRCCDLLCLWLCKHSVRDNVCSEAFSFFFFFIYMTVTAAWEGKCFIHNALFWHCFMVFPYCLSSPGFVSWTQFVNRSGIASMFA